MGINMSGVVPVEANIQTQTVRDITSGQCFVNLQKDQFLNLSKQSANLRYVTAGLGWDPIQSTIQPQIQPPMGGIFPAFSQQANQPQSYDLDVCAFFKVDGRFTSAYFGARYPISSVSVSEDNRTGDGEGDDEQAYFDLIDLPPSVNKIFIGVSIFEANIKKQSFKNIQNAYIRIMNVPSYRAMSGDEVCRYICSNAGEAQSLLFGSLERQPNNDWFFTSIDQPVMGDMNALASLANSLF